MLVGDAVVRYNIGEIHLMMGGIVTTRIIFGFRNTCLHVHDELKEGEQEHEEGEGREGVVATGHGNVSPEPWKYTHRGSQRGLLWVA